MADGKGEARIIEFETMQFDGGAYSIARGPEGSTEHIGWVWVFEQTDANGIKSYEEYFLLTKRINLPLRADRVTFREFTTADDPNYVAPTTLCEFKELVDVTNTNSPIPVGERLDLTDNRLRAWKLVPNYTNWILPTEEYCSQLSGEE